MGPGLLPILYALKDTAAFFIVTVMSLLAATHAYYNLQIKDDEKRKRENGDERTVVFFGSAGWTLVLFPDCNSNVHHVEYIPMDTV